MLLQSLTVPQPDELVNLSAPGPKPGSQSCNQAGDCDAVFSYAMFRDLQKVQTVFTGIAAHRLFGANLAFQGQTMNGAGRCMVSGNYFQVLQVQPALGRLFDSNDDRLVGEAPVVVLSHAYWTTTFAADPDVLNQTAHRQRPDADHRRRRAARVRRHDARHASRRCSCRSRCAARCSPGCRALGQPAELLGSTCSRVCGPASRSRRRARR